MLRMCGRYRNKLSFNQMQRLAAKAAEASNAQPNLDIRPTTSQWVVRGAPAESELTKMRWGLVPFWHSGKALKDFKLTTFNAKSETVATAATFKGFCFSGPRDAQSGNAERMGEIRRSRTQKAPATP